MKITKQYIADFEDQKIIKYSLIANNKFQVDILNYGCIICGIFTSDKNGKLENVILAYDDFADYVTNIGYFGAVIGRHAGRIGGGQFTVDNVKYNVSTNREGNNLHGGNRGIDKRVWQVSELDNGILLCYNSPHLEEGFPGNIKFEVYYQIIKENTLSITYKAIPDRNTIINLTNHTSFNLSGCLVSAINHFLSINADKFCSVGASGLVTGEFVDVTNTPFDFRQSKKINSQIHEKFPQLEIVGGGYDHPFILNQQINKPNIVLYDENSGRQLNITTNQSAVIFYSGNFYMPGGKINHKYYASKHLGICLETQNIPNAINIKNLHQSVIYSPNKPYLSTTEWEFSVT
jgi:aldose 1-epimerase